MGSEGYFPRAQLKDLLLSVGSHKTERRLSPAEVGALLHEASVAGVTRQELAEVLGIGATQVGEFLKVHELSKEVRDLAGWGAKGAGQGGTIPFSSLAQLRGLTPRDQRLVSDAILEHGLTWKEVVGLVQCVRRSGQGTAHCLESTVAQRPVVERRHVLIGAVTDKVVAGELQGLTQQNRDEMLLKILSDLGAGEVVKDVRLAPSRFVVVTEVDLAGFVQMSAEDLEFTVVSRIRTELGQ